MNGYIKRSEWVAAILLGYLMSVPAQAASFDCAKAGTKVEHIICDNPEISKLDEELATSYKAAVQDKQQARSVMQEQKQWLKERNGCVDTNCVKQAYEVRLGSMALPLFLSAQLDIFAMPERDRGELVSKLLNKSDITLRAGPYEEDDKRFCMALLDDFKQQRNIEYIEPIFRTNDYNHPELVKLRNQCPNIKWQWMAPKKCDARSLAYWLMKDYRGNLEDTLPRAKEMCDTLFGKDELALHEIDFADHKEHVIYQSRTPKLDHEELDRLLRKPTKKELWHDNSAWNRRTNMVMNVFFSGAGYRAFDFEKCKANSIGKLANWGTTSSQSIQGLMLYRGKYMAYNLMRSGRQEKRYGLVLSGREPVCHFDVIQSNAINTGSAK